MTMTMTMTIIMMMLQVCLNATLVPAPAILHAVETLVKFDGGHLLGVDFGS